MGVEIQLFARTDPIFVWGWMKNEVYKEKVNTTDELVARIMNSAALINPLKPELNPICYLLALLGAHHFLHVSRIRVKLLTLR